MGDITTTTEKELTPEQQAFDFLQRRARMYAQSDLVPPQFKASRDNPLEKAISNCIIAMEMAARIRANEVMVMQNLYIVHGRPAWSSQFLISMFNSTPGFEKLRYEFQGTEGSDDWKCRAYTTEQSTGEKLHGTWVSIDMAKKEGWHGKNGSKWKTMPEQMLRYRAAAFFIRTVAPEISMGIMTDEEVKETTAAIVDEPKRPMIDAVIESAKELPKTYVADEGTLETKATWEEPKEKDPASEAQEPDDEPVETTHDLFKTFKGK